MLSIGIVEILIWLCTLQDLVLSISNEFHLFFPSCSILRILYVHSYEPGRGLEWFAVGLRGYVDTCESFRLELWPLILTTDQ
jgi:hypothetical protein